MKIVAAIVVVMWCVAPAVGQAGQSQWERAASYFRDHSLLPSRVVVRTEVAGPSGELYESSQLHSRLMRGGKGEVIFVVTEGLVDGRHISPGEMAEMTEVVEEEELTGPFRLFSALQEEFTWASTGLCKEFDGRTGCGYTFDGRRDGRDISGTIWLDEEEELPLLVSWKATDVPFSEDDLLIHGLQQEDRYRISEGGIWCLGSSTTRINGDYSFFFMKKEISLVTTQEYYEHTPRENLPQSTGRDS